MREMEHKVSGKSGEVKGKWQGKDEVMDVEYVGYYFLPFEQQELHA